MCNKGPVFAHLFQQSINTGEIPKEWSLANICPLFKKGDGSLACNYRPVSLTCIPCKLLQHIVCSNIMGHLDQYYRVIALISVNIVPSWDIEGRELASVRRYPNEGQYSPISVR